MLFSKDSTIIQALFFGIWHITDVIILVLDGSMNIVIAVLMSIGYKLLSKILAYEWGICAVLTGMLWTGVLYV